ncbi:hypothetical protein GCM10023196_052290 [Actinoallomurus vinaceus]|uniref:Uncharacterized protein n=1 Tax=Actinoallomurus vinaceus TaxID=1080074 RepID=A0ABP8UF10_9ACTN
MDALAHDEHGSPWWLSADWLRTHEREPVGHRLLRRLIDHSETVPGPLTSEENGADFYAYILAARPSGLTTAALGNPAWRIGATGPESVALILAGDGRDTIHAGGPEALDALGLWVETWRSAGRPGYRRLRPELHRSEDGWIVRAAL